MQRKSWIALRAAIAGIACAGASACGADDEIPPPSAPPLGAVTGYCRATERENSPAMYRCYGRSIREEPLYNNENGDLYAVLAAKADLLAERLERRQVTIAEARLLWETAKSDAQSESIRRTPPLPPPSPPPGP